LSRQILDEVVASQIHALRTMLTRILTCTLHSNFTWANSQTYR